MKCLNSLTIILVCAALMMLLLASAVAHALPHSSVFPSRFHGTTAHKRALAAEAAYEVANGWQRNTTANWLAQPVYHNGQAGEPTFQQKWYYDTTFWPGASTTPKATFAQLYINGEGPIHGSPSGYMTDIARQTNSLLVTMEHRWYGESLPGNRTNTPFLLSTLNVSLVLDDLGNFMTHVENTLNNGQPLKWYCSGGSYSGALSSWLKARFPDRLIMAWSSSGVVNPIFDFTQFDGHIKKVVQGQCEQQVRLAFQQMSDLYDSDKAAVLAILGGVQEIFTKADLAWMLADGSAMQVQYGGKDNLCNTMLNRQVNPGQGKPYYSANTDALYRLKHSIDVFWGETWLTSLDSNCYYSTECLSNVQYQAHWGPAGYSWVTQCCTQFGWWQVGYHNSLRLKSVLTTEYYQSQCRAMLHSPTLFPQIYSYNALHGGAQPKSTNVIATHGSDDPWQTAGVRQDYPEQNYFWKLAQCHGCGHCGDLQPVQPNEPASLTAQRQWISNYVNKWLGTGLQAINPKKLLGFGQQQPSH